MVDFKAMREGKGKPLPKHPRDIFNALPKPLGINDLYASQAEVLNAWYERRGDKDTVIKLHTGGGKTLCALLIAQSVMNESGEPVLYLAPNKQLVDQVQSKSREYGIATLPYIAGKGELLPAEFENGKAVLVGSYEALFNGKSRFGYRGGPRAPIKLGAIILDDAHVALSSVRDAFSLTVKAKDHRNVYDELVAMFRQSFNEVGRGGAFHDIVQNNDFGVLEVPDDAWRSKVSEVQQFLASHVFKIEPLVWTFLRDMLPYCHCLFSRSSVTITPFFPPVDLVPSFVDCARRIYMSATIANDSEIVRTFGAAPDLVAKPISSQSLAGVGERMILVPQLMKLGNVGITPLIKGLAKQVSAKKMGVAVLAPSGEVAKTWQDTAQYPATANDVLNAVQSMQSGQSYGPIVLANRYDGIDLAGNACRCLIMDGLPQGTDNYDTFRMNVVHDAAVNSLMAQRIEQGIGRGTRGGGDYCVVVLMGTGLVGWIGRLKNLAHLTASTRVQLDMGKEVSAAVTTVQEMGDTLIKCLTRDPDWVSYHAQELAAAAHGAAVDTVSLMIAGRERKAFQQARLGQYEAAIQTLEGQIEDLQEVGEASLRAWLWSMAARYAAAIGDFQRSQRFQTNAFSVNNNHTPPKVRPVYQVRPFPGTQAKNIVSKLFEYSRRGSLLADFQESTVNLVAGASANRYEDALRSLGEYLGFDAERPEKIYQIGPDVLWRTGGSFDFVIEAKHKKEEGSPLFKNEHAQLLEAEHWFQSQYPDRSSLRVSAIPNPTADQKVSSGGTMAFRTADITKLAGAVRNLLSDLISTDGSPEVLMEKCEVEINRLKLTPGGIKSEYMTPFEVKKF